MTSGHDDDDNDDREKPSWRDIDRQRDGSAHASKEPGEQRAKSPRKEWAQKMYLKEIENLFKGKKATKEHAAALKEVHERAGTKKFVPAVKKYLKEYGMPDDWSTLFLLLDYEDTKVAKDAVTALLALEPEALLNLKEGLKSKLNIIIMTATDDDLREIAEEALQHLQNP
jgi:hypothetical protein